MKWINNYTNDEVRKKADEMVYLSSKIDAFEDDMIDNEFDSEMRIRKEAIEDVLQDVAIQLIDFHYLAKKHLHTLLDEIAEIDKDALLKKAEECL